MWINKFRTEKNKGRPNRGMNDYEVKESNIGTQVVRDQYGRQNWDLEEEISQCYGESVEQAGSEIVAIDTVEKFKKKLNEF